MQGCTFQQSMWRLKTWTIIFEVARVRRNPSKEQRWRLLGLSCIPGLTELVIRLDKDQDWGNGILINVPGLF